MEGIGLAAEWTTVRVWRLRGVPVNDEAAGRVLKRPLPPRPLELQWVATSPFLRPPRPPAPHALRHMSGRGHAPHILHAVRDLWAPRSDHGDRGVGLGRSLYQDTSHRGTRERDRLYMGTLMDTLYLSFTR